MTEYVQIARDSFAREDLIRESVETSSGCEWCGNKRKSGKLFRYGVYRDGIYTRPEWQNELFCSVGCMRIYNGG